MPKKSYDIEQLPAYAQMICRRREKMYPTTVAAAKVAGFTNSYWDNIEKARIPARRGALEKIAAALNMTAQERIHLFIEAANYNHLCYPKEAQEDDRWIRFQLVRTYDTPEFMLFRDEFYDACVGVNRRGMGDYVIRDMTRALKAQYAAVLHDKDIHSAEDLAKALLSVSGLSPSEVAEYACIAPSEISHLLHGHAGRGNVTSHAAAWDYFSYGLMLDRLGLHIEFHNALNRARQGTDVTPPRSVQVIIAELTTDKQPAAAAVILALCDDRMGEGKPFANMNRIEKHCGLSHSRLKKAMLENYPPRQETVQKLAAVLGLNPVDTHDLLTLARQQYRQNRSLAARDAKGWYAAKSPPSEENGEGAEEPHIIKIKEILERKEAAAQTPAPSRTVI